jgi:predicted nucleic acid-binding protein
LNLVDTSVWIDHFRSGNEVLSGLLEAEQVVMHPFVIGELAMGFLPENRAVLSQLGRLPQVTVVAVGDMLRFIETNGLYGRGIGYIDAHLLASLRITPGVRLWTADRRLKNVASAFDLDAKLTN